MSFLVDALEYIRNRLDEIDTINYKEALVNVIFDRLHSETPYQDKEEFNNRIDIFLEENVE